MFWKTRKAFWIVTLATRTAGQVLEVLQVSAVAFHYCGDPGGGGAHEKQFRSFQDKCVQILLKSIVKFGIENFQHYVKSAPKVLSISRLYYKFSICTSFSVRIMLLSVKIRNVLCEKENGTFKRKVVISRSKSLARPQLVGNLPKVAIWNLQLANPADFRQAC